jgi:hypothetical protein
VGATLPTLSPSLRLRALVICEQMQATHPIVASRQQSRLRGVLSALKRGVYGNSAWGRWCNSYAMIRRRWKRRDRMEATFPFRNKVTPQPVEPGPITPGYGNSPPPTGSGPKKAQKYVSRYKGPKKP